MGIDINMWVKSKKKYEEAELKELNYRFMEATSISSRVTAIELETSGYVPDDGFFYYDIYSPFRYYSEGYARGPWDSITTAINWLRYNFKDSEILYGGDCMVDECPILTKERQNEIDEFWFKSGGLTYRERKPDNELFAQKCPNCDVLMNQYMWSGGNGELICLGCKYKIETKDQGKTWQEIIKK